MKILCKTDLILEAGQQVNRIGKFLYRHMDSCYDIQFSPNTCDVYFVLYYQIPAYDRWKQKIDDDEVNEMDINVNITTYQNKIRVNVIELSPKERTLGFNVFKPEEMQDLVESQNLIMEVVKKRVEKAYEDYDFVF